MANRQDDPVVPKYQSSAQSGSNENFEFQLSGKKVLKITENGNGDVITGTLINVTDTWNDIGTVFKAIAVNITDSASDNTSSLLNLSVGGVTRFDVNEDGSITQRSVTNGPWWSITNNNGINIATSYASPFAFSTEVIDIVSGADYEFNIDLHGNMGSVNIGLMASADGATYNVVGLADPANGNSFHPATGTPDLGQSAKPWKDGWFSGKVTTGTVNATTAYQANNVPGVDSGTFTTADNKTVTVTLGLITSII